MFTATTQDVKEQPKNLLFNIIPILDVLFLYLDTNDILSLIVVDKALHAEALKDKKKVSNDNKYYNEVKKYLAENPVGKKRRCCFFFNYSSSIPDRTLATSLIFILPKIKNDTELLGFISKATKSTQISTILRDSLRALLKSELQINSDEIRARVKREYSDSGRVSIGDYGVFMQAQQDLLLLAATEEEEESVIASEIRKRQTLKTS